MTDKTKHPEKKENNVFQKKNVSIHKSKKTYVWTNFSFEKH